TAPTWSRDGTRIYFSENRAGGRDIWRVSATGGPAQQVTRTGSGFLAYESADGTSLVYQPKFGDSPLLVMPLTGDGTPQPLVDCVRPAAFAIAGHRVVYVACEPGTNPPLQSIDMASGRDRLLGRLEHFPPDTLGTGIAASPDGKTILFRRLVRGGADLMLVENFR